MPYPAQTSLTRRQILAGMAGLALLAGCTTGAPAESRPADPDPLIALLDEHVALAAVYARAVKAGPDDVLLTGLAGNLAQHIKALAGALAVAPPSVPSSSSTPTAAQPGAAPGSTAADPALQRAALRDGEAALAARSRELAIALRPERAPLLASIAASHACAAEALK